MCRTYSFHFCSFSLHIYILFGQCKSELFLIPYFSWCASAFGGVPINRSNREQAVKAIGAAASAARLGECMAIAPEGTRSLTGQLLEFKKGPFHLWEQLQTPIIPIITMGAFELFPPGSQMTHPGKVYIRFLDPIYPGEAQTKEEIGVLVRTRMLEALQQVPEDVAAELTWRQRIICWLNMVGIYWACWEIYKFIHKFDLLTHFQMSYMQMWGVVASVSILTTLFFYVYAVYCAPIVRTFFANSVAAVVKRSSIVWSLMMSMYNFFRIKLFIGYILLFSLEGMPAFNETILARYYCPASVQLSSSLLPTAAKWFPSSPFISFWAARFFHSATLFF